MPIVHVLDATAVGPLVSRIQQRELSQQEVSQLLPVSVKTQKASYMFPAESVVVHMTEDQKSAYEASLPANKPQQATGRAERNF